MVLVMALVCRNDEGGPCRQADWSAITGAWYLEMSIIHWDIVLGGCIYIYIIYTPNLGLGIAVLGREREQGRFRGSTEGAGESVEGTGGVLGEQGGSTEGALSE